MAAMRILNPAGKPHQPPTRLAPRPSDLNGKVLWIVDGHGDSEGGQPVMNKIFKGWRQRLEQEYDFAAVNYVRTDNIATPFRHGKEMFQKIVDEADVVINGVAL